MHKIIPVIISGGSGTRLWPLSRKQHPKQYLSLFGDNTMLQETILRLDGIENITDPIIVCNACHRFLVAEQCQQINIKNPVILLEPVGRNTASAIAAAAILSLKQLDDAVLLVLPADHVIQDIDAFHGAISIANAQAKKDKLVTFGIVPTDANTGYGYIKSFKDDIDGAYKVEKFIEKPNHETAQSYLKHGDYLWNSGMFMFNADTLIDELVKYAPDIFNSVSEAVNNAKQDLDFIRLDKQAFESSPSDSIDYALMEKTNNLVVVPLDVKWNDVGTWAALYDIGIKDANGNVILGDVYAEETTDTYISANHHIVATIGVQDLVIVDTPDATLILSKDKAQKVNKIVDRLQKKYRKESGYHRKVYRPWGWFDSLDKREGFQVKRIYINPGASLSIQSHKYRSEHWVVVKGTAIVLKGDESFILNVNQSTYISMGELHSLKNASIQNYLEIIEVQCGSYLEEDDIIRYNDDYNRN
jgi:mannose-1-phosphate guanylyltransferase/mannose-6-phosphate isomerase